ncbi:uncharacterized protein LOC122722075 [Manihot esculenta]|uniref:uncharacterized protein LOC122722075 n=1 Tax=Manihot esculenta TaxID=3983 RepID=UPI001CC372D2|nr:uncharacterized protein LOC122722075 [Manihot esculenta]
MLAYGLPDEYVKILESTAIESLKIFCRAIIEVFGEQYLRSPTAEDVARLLYIGKQRGFPGMYCSSRSLCYSRKSIYPKWSTIVQTIRELQIRKKYFAIKQESCQKDVERAFGALQSRFAIVARPSRFLKEEVLHDILTTCIIMHNMIIDDESDLSAPIEDGREFLDSTVEMVVDETTRFDHFLARHKKIKDKDAHFALRNALIEHL